jgi:hypothetical protein
VLGSTYKGGVLESSSCNSSLIFIKGTHLIIPAVAGIHFQRVKLLGQLPIWPPRSSQRPIWRCGMREAAYQSRELALIVRLVVRGCLIVHKHGHGQPLR